MVKVSSSLLGIAALILPLLAQGPPVGRGHGKIKIEPDTVYFYKTGTETTLTRTVEVKRTGPPNQGSLSLTATVTNVSGGSWLTVSPLSNGILNLTATPGSLGPSVYEAKVTVTPSGQGATPLTINAFLIIITGPGGAPAAFVRPASLNFRATQNGANPEPKALNISSPTGGASFPWTAAKNPPNATWFQISSSGGTGAAQIIVTVNIAGLAPGQYTGSINIASGQSSVQVPVVLDVMSPGPQGQANKLVISPKAFNFIVHPGLTLPGPKTLSVKTTGNSPLSWTATITSITSNGNWLLTAGTTAAAGSTPGSIQLSLNPAVVATLSKGSYEGSVKVTAAGKTETARVFLRVVGPPGPRPGPGNPEPTGAVTLSAVQVTPRVIEFSSTNGVATPASVPVKISSGVANLTFTAARTTARGGAWFNISSSSGSIPATISVTASSAGLTPGIYTGLITLNIAGSVTEQRLILVTLRVSTPGEVPRLALSRGGIDIRATQGGANPPGVQVALQAVGAATIAYQGTVSTVTGGNWLSVTPGAGNAPGNVTVNVSITGLAAGAYKGAVVFQATGSPGALPATLNVLLVVTPPAAVTSTSTLPVVAAETDLVGLMLQPPADFIATADSAADVRAVVVSAGGTAVVVAEVTVTSSGVEPPFRLEHLGNGVYEGVFRSLNGGPVALSATAIRPSGAIVNFGIGGDLEGSAQSIPVIFQEGIVSTASYAPGATPVAAGAILSLFGKDLTDSTALASTLPLPRELAGVKVLVGGVEAPLIAVIADAGEGFDQINFQLPFELANASYADVVVFSNGAFSDPEGISMAAGVPAIFTMNQQGTGPAAALHSDFSLITAARPARAGETILLFATGLGEVRPALATGEAASTVTNVASQVQARIGGRPATVAFAGLAPGFVGLYQINLVVPDGISPGDASVELTVEGIGSGDGPVVSVN